MDLASKLLQFTVAFLVARHIKYVHLLAHGVGNLCQWVLQHRLDHEEDLAEADSFLQDGNQIFIFLGHVLDLLPKFLLNVDEISKLLLESTHLHVFELPVFFVQLRLHL